MELEYSFGQVEISISVNGNMIKEVGKVYISGRMADNTKVTGLWITNMEKVH